MLAAAATAIAPHRRKIRVRVAGDADALWERILADEGVRRDHQPAPEPGPPKGPPLLVWREADVIRVRHWSGNADAASPVMVLRMRPDRGALAVDARIEQPRASRSFVAVVRQPSVLMTAVPIVLLSAILVLAYAVAGSALLAALPLLLLLFAIPSALVMLPALALWNAESRRHQREALVAWLGRTLVPIALPGDTDAPGPFR
jgi:hypothetical protein